MTRRQARQPANDVTPNVDPVMARVHRLRSRGKARRAMLFLKDACCRESHDARLWTQYGAQCVSMGDLNEARRAYKHALWLRERERDHGRASTTRQLLEGLDVSPSNAA